MEGGAGQRLRLQLARSSREPSGRGEWVPVAWASLAATPLPRPSDGCQELPLPRRGPCARESARDHKFRLRRPLCTDPRGETLKGPERCRSPGALRVLCGFRALCRGSRRRSRSRGCGKVTRAFGNESLPPEEPWGTRGWRGAGSGSGAAGWGCLGVGMSHIEVQLSLRGRVAGARFLTLWLCFFTVIPRCQALRCRLMLGFTSPHRRRAGTFLGLTEQPLKLRRIRSLSWRRLGSPKPSAAEAGGVGSSSEPGREAAWAPPHSPAPLPGKLSLPWDIPNPS